MYLLNRYYLWRVGLNNQRDLAVSTKPYEKNKDDIFKWIIGPPPCIYMEDE